MASGPVIVPAGTVAVVDDGLVTVRASAVLLPTAMLPKLSVLGAMVNEPSSNVVVIWTWPGRRRTTSAVTVCPPTRVSVTGAAEPQVGIALDWTCAHSIPNARSAIVALPAGNPSIVIMGEVPGVMVKSCVLEPNGFAVGVIAISKHSASAGTLTKAMAIDHDSKAQKWLK